MRGLFTTPAPVPRVIDDDALGVLAVRERSDAGCDSYDTAAWHRFHVDVFGPPPPNPPGLNAGAIRKRALEECGGTVSIARRDEGFIIRGCLFSKRIRLEAAD